MSELHLKDFSYHLPEELIAQTPLAERSASRLLVRRSTGIIEHRFFRDLPQILPAGTLLLVNDSRVLPGRLMGQLASGGKIELMLLRAFEGKDNEWLALGRPFKKLKKGIEIYFPSSLVATVCDRIEDGPQPSLRVQFNCEKAAFLDWLEREAYIPLPPYINRETAQTAEFSPDRDRYQTIYAEEKGSVAAPTAGLHFDQNIWDSLAKAGVEIAKLTLHVGAGTFLPVKTEKIAEHAMHEERFRMSRQSLDQILRARAEHRPIVAVGTTSLRCLESFARLWQEEDPYALCDRWLATQLFLFPKNKQDRVQAWALHGLLTNFHQPESSLLMLVAALIGFEEQQNLYRVAVEQRYRFLSYGDTSLLWLKDP